MSKILRKMIKNLFVIPAKPAPAYSMRGQASQE